jgi:hypothetical protein
VLFLGALFFAGRPGFGGHGGVLALPDAGAAAGTLPIVAISLTALIGRFAFMQGADFETTAE